jgi:2-keto-4-pentenoate hydratase
MTVKEGRGMSNADEIAKAFVDARRKHSKIATYPGQAPQTIVEAYNVQDLAIDLWGAAPAGWKVGRIVGEKAKEYGTDRLAGPIFNEYLWCQAEAPEIVGVFGNGFAAVEGEVVAIIARDTPTEKTDWTVEDAWRFIGSMHAGVEIASSPYRGINEDGPLVTISDFGNNRGLIIGDEIPDWRSNDTYKWRCRTLIDDKLIGEKTAAEIPGGPIESVRFLLENTARRGLALKKGAAICTGAITGVHEINLGQKASIEFDGARAIKLSVADLSSIENAVNFQAAE